MAKKFYSTLCGRRFRCRRCKITMVPPIYKCPNGHNSCEDCKFRHPCTRCNEAVGSIRNLDLENDAYNSLYPCRWDNRCGPFSCQTIRAHESSCRERIYKCPMPFCTFDGYFSEIPVHIDLNHDYVKFHPYPVYKTTSKRDHVWHMLAYYEIFVCKFSLDQETAEWSMHLQAPHSRARELVCELELDGKFYPLKLVNYFGPKYEIELPYSEIPVADDFYYSLRVSRSNKFIV